MFDLDHFGLKVSLFHLLRHIDIVDVVIYCLHWHVKCTQCLFIAQIRQEPCIFVGLTH